MTLVSRPAVAPGPGSRILLAGVPIDLHGLDGAVRFIAERAGDRTARALGVASINLDHVHHFGDGARWEGVLEPASTTGVEWLNLIDGAPVAARARELTGQSWPRLAGSDIIAPILAEAEARGLSVGFLGGAVSTHELLRTRLAERYPALRVSGFWAPARSEIEDAAASLAVAAQVAAAGTDLLVVGLGKPRQELWISRYGSVTGAQVLLAFGAVVDFLADRIARAPRWISDHGLEWAWRLAAEPTRLAHRYLIENPPAYVAVRRADARAPKATVISAPRPRDEGGLVPLSARADVAVLTDTPFSADFDAIVGRIREQCTDTRLRLVVTSPHPQYVSDIDIADAVHVGVDSASVETRFRTALRFAGEASAFLIVRGPVQFGSGAIRAMLDRLDANSVGAVVPCLVGEQGIARTHLGLTAKAATVPARLPGRVSQSVPVERSDDYSHAHRLFGDSAGIILLHREVVDEFGLPPVAGHPKRLTAYFTTLAQHGVQVWYEPDAIVEALP